MHAGTIAEAVRPAVHDVTDGSALRSWLNSPLSSGLAADIYTATNILHSFAQIGSLQPEKGIPAAVLSGARGFAILSVVKVSMVLPFAIDRAQGFGIMSVSKISTIFCPAAHPTSLAYTGKGQLTCETKQGYMRVWHT